jgi:hypothetical protein
MYYNVITKITKLLQGYYRFVSSKIRIRPDPDRITSFRHRLRAVRIKANTDVYMFCSLLVQPK